MKEEEEEKDDDDDDDRNNINKQVRQRYRNGLHSGENRNKEINADSKDG